MVVDGQPASSDVPMETDATDGGKDTTTSKKTTTSEAKGAEAPKFTAVASGLPQSKEELETLITSIHQSVKDSVLPRLHKCLTAKVHTHTHRDFGHTHCQWTIT